MGKKSVNSNQLLSALVPLDTLFLDSIYGATQNSVSWGYYNKRLTFSIVSCILCMVNVFDSNEASVNNGRKSCPQ